MSHRHNFVTISGRKFTENAEKPGRRAPERVPLPGFLSIKWHVVFKMKAHRRPVSGCGSQRMLHALERRSHPADHGSSFASLYSPFCRYATSSPDRGKSLLAGGGQLSCNSRTGQIKNPPSECSGSNHIRHSYRMGLATTTTAASGRCREELLGQRPARRTQSVADAGSRNPGAKHPWQAGQVLRKNAKCRALRTNKTRE